VLYAHPFAGGRQRTGRSNTFDKLSTGYLHIGKSPASDDQECILKNYVNKVNKTMKIRLDFPLDLKTRSCQHLRRLWEKQDIILENGKDERWRKKANF
jgi:hypothetical protein